jgi:multidrug resistance efflux pump
MNTLRSYSKHSKQTEEQSKSYLTKEIVKKRILAFDEIQHCTNSIELMRKKYKQADWYERKELEKNAQQLKDRIKKRTTQYKIHVKEGLDDFGSEVVDTLF